MTQMTHIEMVWRAFVATVQEAGPLPQRIEDAPAHFAAHCRLMRMHDPRLRTFGDAEIRALIAVD